jgi:hypothetical protein
MRAIMIEIMIDPIGRVCYRTYPTMPKDKGGGPRLQKRRRRLVKQVPDLERLLRGSLVERYKKCGKPGCHCVHSKGHGPALYLSVTLAPGQTRSYYVPEEQRRRIERYLGNYRKLRDVVEEITAINRELLERAALDDEA